MKLRSVTILSSIYSAIRMLGGMISVKVVATYLGPTGVAYVGQLQSFLAIVNNLSNLGIGNGTIKYLAEHRESPKLYKNFLGTALLLTIFCSSVLAILIFLYADAISLYLFQSVEYKHILFYLALSLLLFSSAQLLSQALNAFQEINKLIYARIAASLLGLGLTVLSVYCWGVEGALLALVLSQAVGFFVLLGISYKSAWFKHLFSLGSSKSLKKLLAYSLMTFSSIILLNIRQIYLRDYVAINLSAVDAGYWQAIWKISEMYLTVITTALAIYYLPKLSSIKKPELLQKEIFAGYRFLLPLVLTLSILIFLFRDLIIYILFTEEFTGMRELFFYQLIGDVFKIAAWILSFLMLAKAMIRMFIITEILFISLFWGLAILGVETTGVIGLTQAFAFTYFLYFLTMLVIFRKLLFTKFKTEEL